jgi:photosystem II PsbZ protein
LNKKEERGKTMEVFQVLFVKNFQGFRNHFSFNASFPKKLLQSKNISIFMTSILQISLLALIAVSFALVVGVPVVFATPNGWSENKGIVFSGLSLWLLLVFAVGIFNSFVI